LLLSSIIMFYLVWDLLLSFVYYFFANKQGVEHWKYFSIYNEQVEEKTTSLKTFKDSLLRIQIHLFFHFSYDLF